MHSATPSMTRVSGCGSKPSEPDGFGVAIDGISRWDQWHRVGHAALKCQSRMECTLPSIPVSVARGSEVSEPDGSGEWVDAFGDAINGAAVGLRLCDVRAGWIRRCHRRHSRWVRWHRVGHAALKCQSRMDAAKGPTHSAPRSMAWALGCGSAMSEPDGFGE